MADISKIVLPNGTQYDIKDVTARSGLVDKVDKVSGKGLSTNDYTTDEKNKLAGVATGAEANVQSDWDETDSSSDAFIKNKPTISEDDGLDARLNGDTEITTNTDLNDYITPGEYYCHISPQERNITNYPINLAFRLRVEYSFNSNVSLGDMRQTFIPYNRSYYYVRTREFVNSAYKWNDWEKLSPTDNNFTTTLKDKLSGIADGAEVNVQADWNVTDTSSDAYIKNKPTIPTDTRNTFYGECATAAATAAKVVTVSSDQNFALKAGVMIGIKFTNTNTAENVTFNVNGTGAKDIWYNDYAYTGSSNNITGYAGRLLFYMYDGTHWCIVNKGWIDNNTTYTAASEVPEMDGTAAVGTSTKYAREDHVHPVDTSRAPKAHASTATTYGQGNASNYGHVKLSNTYSSSVSGANAAGGVGASQNALYNAYNAITSGSVAAGKASSLVPTSSAAFETDVYGNFNHKRTTATDDWSINANDGTENLRVFYETGKLIAGGQIVVHAPGDNVSIADYITTGFITSSQTRLSFSVPAILTTGVTAASCTSLSVTVRHIGGNYPYMCYGSSNNTYEQLGSSRVSIWENSKTVRTNGVSNIDVSVRGQFLSVYVDFNNTLRTNAGTTVVTNNTPMALHVTGVFKLS